MPHFVVEYSANLASRHDLAELARVVHKSAARTGLFPVEGIRVRLYEAVHYEIADGDPRNGFVAMLARIGAGRSTEDKAKAGQAIFDAVCAFLGHDVDSGYLMVSLDMQENDPDVSFKRNSVRSRLSH